MIPPVLRAGALCVAATLFYAGANALGKAAQTTLPGPDLHPVQVTAARFLFAFLALLPFLAMRGPRVFRTAVPLWHVQRVILGAAGIGSIFWALRTLPLSDVSAIAFSSPLFTLVFAAGLMAEGVDARRWIAAIVGFIGVVVLVRPTGAVIDPAALIAVAAALFIGAEVATIRLLAVRDPTLTVLALNNAIGAALTCAAAVLVFVPPSMAQLAALAGLGVLMVTGQAIFLKAMAIAEASQVGPFYYSKLVWAAIIGVVAFGETLDPAFFIGAGLIVAAGLYVGWPRRSAGPVAAEDG